MSITKPYTLPRWSTNLLNNGPLGSSNRSEPDEIKKDSGFNHGERPQRQTFNWLQNLNNEWITYFDKQWESAGQVNFNFSQNLDLTTGLNFAIDAGTVTFDGVESTISSSTLTLNPNSTTVIGFDLDALTISQYTSGGEPTSDFVKLFVVTTNASAITVVDDRRTFFQVQSRLQSGDNKLIIDGASDTLSYTNNGVSVIHATNAANIGINTANPFGKLHVKQGSSGAPSVNNGGSTLVMEHSTTGGFTILTPNNVEASMFMGDPQSSTDGGFQYNHANLELSLRAGDVQRVFVNGATGNLGVGVNGAAAKVHIKQGPSGYGSVATSADGILIEDSTSTGINIQVPNTQDCNIAFGDPENAFIGGVRYLHAGDILALRANSTDVFTINSLGDVGINTVGGAALARLHVRDGDSGASALSEGIFVENSGNCSVMIGTGPTSTGSLIFADTGSNIVGSVQYDHSTDKMHLGTAGAINATITNTGRLGLGIQNPLGQAHIQQGSSGVPSITAAGGTLVLEGATASGISILTPNTVTGNILFGDPENSNAGSYSFNHADNTHSIQVAGVSKVNVSSGVTTITNDLSVSGSTNVPNLSATGLINAALFKAGDGTVGAPSYSFSDDSDTGIYSPSSGAIAMSSAGVERLRLTIDGNLGIGVNPSFKLDVNGSTNLNSGSTYKINSVDVLSSTTLGSSVVNSSLTSVGTLSSLTVSGTTNTNDLVVAGNLTVNGTVSTINSTTITVDDKNIELGSVTTPTDATANGGGITLKGTTDKTINWTAATGDFDVSENWDLASGKSYKIDSVTVLNNDTLGSGVVNSSLTSVGTLSSLTVSGNERIGGNSIIGATSGTALGQLHVKQGTSGVTAVYSSADSLVVEDVTAAGYTVATSNVGRGYIAFTDPDAVNPGLIEYDHLVNRLSLQTNSASRMTIGSSGRVLLADAADTLTPQGRLHVRDGASGVTLLSDKELVVESNDSTIIQLMSPNTATPAIFFADPQANSAGGLEYSHVNGKLSLRVEDQNRLSISSSGNVILSDASETVTPLAKLHVREGLSGVTPFGNTDTLFLENSTHAGLTIGTPNNREGSIFFADPESNTQGGISYSHSSDYMAFRAGNTEGARLEADGDFFLGTGRLGVGITPSSGKIHSQVTSADNVTYIETVTSGNPVLSLSATGAGGYQLYQDRATNSFRIKAEGGADRVVVDSAGKVVIGDNSALARLSIRENSANTTFTSTAYPAGISGIYSVNESNTNGSFNALTLTSRNTPGVLQTASIVSQSVSTATPPNMLFVTGDNSSNTSSTKMMIDSSGNLGIGTSAPLAKTHVKSGASGLASTHGNYDELVLESAGHTGMTISSAAGFNGNILFTDSVNAITPAGLISYDNATDSMAFWASGSLACTINNAQQLVVKNGAVGSPSIAFSSDLDTGIYSDTNNVVKIAAGGATPANFGPSQSDIRNTSNVANTLAIRNDSESYSGRVLQVGSFTSASSGFHHIYAISDESAGNNTVFTVKGDGQITSDIGSISTPGADYAEMFEWLDGNVDNEDRVGYSISLVGAKIKIALTGETPIGVVSGAPTIIGDGHDLSWSGKWLTDDFGRRILDENGNQQYSPDYDPEAEYIPRSKRKEWSPVGLMGKLVLRKGQVTAPTWIKLKDINDDLELWLVR